MNQEIQKIIAENLPEMAAKEMKQFIEEAEAQKVEFEAQKEANVIISERTENLKKQLSSALQQIHRQDIVAERELSCAVREEEIATNQRDLANKLLNNTLIMAQKSQEDLLRLVDKVFGHPNVVVSTSKTVRTPVEGSNGCSGWVQENQDIETETTEHGKS